MKVFKFEGFPEMRVEKKLPQRAKWFMYYLKSNNLGRILAHDKNNDVYLILHGMRKDGGIKDTYLILDMPNDKVWEWRV